MKDPVFRKVLGAMRGALCCNSLLRDWRMRLKMMIAPDSREALAVQYIKGDGIEIGALHQPLQLPARAKVLYVDRLSVYELRRQYPELRNNALVAVDVEDDGEVLGKFSDNSLDFVIANHFLEHCENPICAVTSFLRVLRPGGVIYLAIPDKRFTFDSERAVTGLAHLVRDFQDGSECSHNDHFTEWRDLVEIKFGNDKERSMKTLKDGSYSIHFHVWTCAEILELIVYLKRDMGLSFEPEKVIAGKSEIIAILRKV